MIAWFARNHVAANLLMITILLAGIGAIKTSIPLEIFPSFESDIVNINMSLRGATPEDVEQGIAIRIEEAVQDLEGIDEITSISTEGGATVRVEADASIDVRELLNDVKSRVDAINTFPADAEKAIISIAERKRDVISVTVSSSYSEREIREYAEKVRDDLLNLPEITQVALDVVRDYEIAIHVSQAKLQQYQVSLSDIDTAIRNSSVDISAGNIQTQGGDVLVRSKNQAYYQDDFENIVVRTQADGTFLLVKDLATVVDGFEESRIKARFNGERGAMVRVYRIGNQSAIEVADAVKNYIAATQKSLPAGFKLSYWDDDSEIVKKRLNTLIYNALQGGFLVLLLLTIFLRPSIAFWVFIGIPISFMGAFIFMPILGVTINIMSLFGFILVLGIVVDDAIVTGENIYRHSQSGKLSASEAAIVGTKEVATPVTFGILTTVAAFLPLAFIEGFRGAIFAQIPYVVIPVLLFSLIESKFVLPSHLSSLKLRHEKKKTSAFSAWQQNFADGFEQAILTYYQPLLRKTLRFKLSTLALFIGVFILILSFIMSGWTKFVFFPRIPSETVRAYLTMPAGTNFDVIDRYNSRMTDAVIALQNKYKLDNGDSLITGIFSITKGQNARVRFEILPAEINTTSVGSRELVKEWRKLIGTLPGAESLTFRAEIGRGGDPINIQFSGTDLDVLKKVSSEVKLHLATYSTVFDIADSLSDGKQTLEIELTKQGHALGLSTTQLTRQVRNAFFGAQVQRIQRGRDDIRVMLRFPLAERNAVTHLSNMLINTPSGGKVPLAHVAHLIPSQSPAEIKRIDRYRTVNVTADIDKSTTNMTVLSGELNQYLKQLLQQYPSIKYSLEGEAREQSESFGSLTLGIILVFFIIYCLLAIPFKSYIQPIIVMSVIPFGLIGAVIGHWLMGLQLTIFSLLGLMALIGVVVNDSLVLVDFINKQRQAGEKVFNAVSHAAKARFRPVILTSLTTFIGLMPLLFEQETQAQFLIPMAVSLGFGIMFSTFITLILVPVNYVLVEDVKRYCRQFLK